ncbi:MAG: thymidine kinase [Elusimicrobiaceae bacterium]|jgi:thymidine kinase|nr:thymidine kinase [Elusimicrobiaceae bacterium]MBT3955291.1 thymidine kinase [Elusimicrobiaceae bacterium]MBT4008427.1 thymidine kinase [Elusimicrobiaceae bacterium]MBT4403236.1 thymidine kinase [Elusimicrobiaceae bacterium]MBT4439316.1 thymidine kinase [Elusimicrobiaceae bacterium]
MKIKKAGHIEIFCGCMFSGKTTHLIKRIAQLKKSGAKIQVFNFHLDERYGKNNIISHDGKKIKCEMAKNSTDILKHIKKDTDVVAIDEIHFFNKNLVNLCTKLADNGKIVLTSGLDKDAFGKPFETATLIMAEAEYVKKVHAKCELCTDKASFSYRTNEDKNTISVGAKDKYIPLCRNCFNVEYKNRSKK